jgi:hypothetical protein
VIMSKCIEFYNKETGFAVPNSDSTDYFVYNGDEVWCDNLWECSNDQYHVGFSNFIEKCDDIGWRVTNEL